jgi:hypothetical protein
VEPFLAPPSVVTCNSGTVGADIPDRYVCRFCLVLYLVVLIPKLTGIITTQSRVIPTTLSG